MTPGPWADLSEHTGTLVAIIGSLAFICGTLALVVWRIMVSVALTLKTDILAMIKTLDGRIETVREEIGKIRERQDKLREEWPEKYLRIDGIGYKVLSDGIGRIETHFEKFAEDCREGKCGGKVK